MSSAFSALLAIRNEANEFVEAAEADGFDAADALDQLRTINDIARLQIDDVPQGCGLVATTVLMQDRVDPETLSLIEACPGPIVKHRAGAVAIATKLQTFVDSCLPEPAEDVKDMRDRARLLVTMIEASLQEA